MTVKCLFCNTEQKMFYGLRYCPKCGLAPHYKTMVELAKKEVFDDIETWLLLSKGDANAMYWAKEQRKEYSKLKKKHLKGD